MKSERERIDEIITLEKDNTFLTHFLTSILYRDELVCNKNGRVYFIWSSNGWISLFYQVFTFTFNDYGKIKSIKSRMNIYGKTIGLILALGIFIFSIWYLFIPIFTDFELINLFVIFIIIVFMFSFYLVLLRIYRFESKDTLEKIKLSIEIENIENLTLIENRIDEWSIKRTLIRIFTYPLAIFIIFISLFVIKEGNFNGFFGIIIAGIYIISDTWIIIYKRKNRIN